MFKGKVLKKCGRVWVFKHPQTPSAMAFSGKSQEPMAPPSYKSQPPLAPPCNSAGQSATLQPRAITKSPLLLVLPKPPQQKETRWWE